MAFEVRTAPNGELRFVGEGEKPRIDARAIVFNSWSVDLGGFRERLLPGSVNPEADMLALFDHNTSMVLGRTSAGTMEVRSDDQGFSFTAYPPNTTWANDLRESMARGDIKGCSFRMMVEEDFWYVQDGVVCRDIIACTVSEFTVTSMPAYPVTTAEARSQAEAVAAHPEQRIGRVLSSSNEDRIRSAHTALSDVLNALDNRSQNRDATGEDGIYPSTSRQTALRSAIEGVCETFGKFDYSTGPDGSHYTAAEANPFTAEGLVCANCVFYEGPRACEIVDGDIDPDAICKFWIIPADLLTAGEPAPQDPANPDGASEDSRSSDGASESKKAPTFVPGFGFITPKGK